MVLNSNVKITTGHIGGKRNSVMGSGAERRSGKMGSEVLTTKPGDENLRGTQDGGGMIEKNKKLMKIHLSKPKRSSTFQNEEIDEDNNGNLEVLIDEPMGKFDQNQKSGPSEDRV